MIGLFMIGFIAGMAIPIQTSLNSKLGAFTKTKFNASAISFLVGTLSLIILNLILNPHLFTWSFITTQHFSYIWFLGGILGVIFLTGNLILLPKLGASLTVVATIVGQMVMGVVIDTYGFFGASKHPFTWINTIGLLCLLFGVLLMHATPKNTRNHASAHIAIWLVVGFIFGFAPPIQTTVNSMLGQEIGAPIGASMISFLVGTIVLLLICIFYAKSLRIHTSHPQFGKIKPTYFLGGILGVIFVTANIVLMPQLGAALTTVIGMLGMMVMGLLIDTFGWFGVPKRHVDARRIIGLFIIVIGIILLRLV